MTKSMLAAAGLVLLIASAPARADKDVDPRVGAAIACTSITQAEQRLHCYDQAVAGLQQAVKSGQLTVAPQPLKMEGIIKASGPFGFNRAWVHLDSGDRWEVILNSGRDSIPRRGEKVTIQKGLLGGYRFLQRLAPDRRAKYLGRS